MFKRVLITGLQDVICNASLIHATSLGARESTRPPLHKVMVCNTLTGVMSHNHSYVY